MSLAKKLCHGAVDLTRHGIPEASVHVCADTSGAGCITSARVCRAARIHYRRAVVGWRETPYGSNPVVSGVVISAHEASRFEHFASRSRPHSTRRAQPARGVDGILRESEAIRAEHGRDIGRLERFLDACGLSGEARAMQRAWLEGRAATADV
jgi:hypothetical protein